MNYLRPLALITIVLLMACAPSPGEAAPATSPSMISEPTRPPSSMRTVSPRPSIQPVLTTATVSPTPQDKASATPAPTVTATLSTSTSLAAAPPTAITYASQCEVWTQEKVGTLRQITHTDGSVSGFTWSAASSALAYLTEGATFDAPQAVYVKRSADQAAELIFKPAAIEWSRADGYPLLVVDMAFSPDGNLLALTTLTGVWLFDLRASELYHVFEREDGPSDEMGYLWPIFSPQNRWLIVTVQHGESRSEMLLDLESGERFPLPGVQGYTEVDVTHGWIDEEHIVRYSYFYDGEQYHKYKIATYALPAYQEVQTHQLGQRDFFDESQTEDFIITTDEAEAQTLLTTHWDRKVTAVVVDDRVHFLLPGQDDKEITYTTLLRWEVSTQSWELLYKSPIISQGDLWVRQQADKTLVFYVNTPGGDVFHLNLSTQAPELVAEEATFRSGSRHFFGTGCN